MLRGVLRQVRGKLLHNAIPLSRAAFDIDRPVEVVGYVGRTAGIAESARLCAAALSASGHAVRVFDLDAGGETGDRSARDGGPAGTKIFHLNPPHLPRGIVRNGLRRFRETFNIGYWAWELETPPAEWAAAARYMNAILVPSTFTGDAVAKITARPVLLVPHPVTLETANPGMRGALGVAEEAFLVSTIFDFGSSFGRKNPLAAVRAFAAAAGGIPGAVLVVKTTGADAHPDNLARLMEAIAGRPDVIVVRESWPRADVSGLIAASDAFLSLHRSEGFGLSIAEAVMRRVPVVATNWSGNTDFCDPAAAYGVSAKLVPVVDAHPDYAALTSALWAEPDADEAADHLGRIARAPDEARARAERAAASLAAHLAAHRYDDALRRLADGQRAIRAG